MTCTHPTAERHIGDMTVQCPSCGGYLNGDWLVPTPERPERPVCPGCAESERGDEAAV